jgi:hypothetical protein
VFAQRNFVACIEGQLAERNFGPQRKAEILSRFNGLTQGFEAQGYGAQIAQSMAMNRVFEELATITRERAKRTAKTLEVQAANNARILAGKDVSGSAFLMDGGKGRGAGLARAAISLIQSDPRFPGVSVEELRGAYRGKYWAILADGLDKFGKGFMGAQKGASGLYDIVRERFAPGSTKNVDAAAMADAYGKLDDIMVADRNNAGGTLVKLETFHLPQRVNAAAVARTPLPEFHADAMKNWDWDKMRWPDGSPIDPAKRDDVIKQVYETFRTEGANKIDPASFSGHGSAVGNALNEHRFVILKDADAWIRQHEKYGDGNVFDVIQRHVESMAHRTALVQQFGPNPELAIDNLRALVLKHAADISNNPKTALDRQALSEAHKVLKNKLEPMYEVYTHANAMDPNSPFAAGAVATSNIITAAKLGSVPFLAVPGDFQQTLAVRMFNHMPMMAGMDTYLKGVTTNFKEAQSIAARSGHVFDTAVGATYSAERFSPIATYGPAISRRVADGVIRASGLTRHTEIGRWTAQSEFMGLMRDSMEKAYDDLPFKQVLARYGIDASAWDAVRKNITPWTPEPGAEYLRPLDILDTKLANKDALYNQFFAMVSQESKYMVPGATLEAQVFLRGSTRPDTLIGAIAHSFSMYKNFPVSVVMMYGRLAMSQAEDRLRFIAAMGIGMTMVGAMGTQLREIANGRTPMSMDPTTGQGVKFWGKAALAGGAMGVWGDFLFQPVNDFGHTLGSTMAGPLLSFVGDAANVALGGAFKFVSAFDEDQLKTTYATRAANFARQYTPGSSLWWARLALEREIWDTLDEAADPNVYRKRKARIARQEKNYGNTYFLPPGQSLVGD